MLHAGGGIDEAQLLVHMLNNLLKALLGVPIDTRVAQNLLQRGEQLLLNKVLPPGSVLGDNLVDLFVNVDGDRCLICPCAGDIAGSIASTAKHDHGNTKGFAKLCTGTMALDLQVKPTQAITGKRIGTTLEGYDRGAELFVDLADDGLKEVGILLISDAVVKGYIDGVVRTGIVLGLGTVIFETASAGEEDVRGVFVEGTGHDTVCTIESLLDTVAVMNIDVDIEHSRIAAQNLENGKNDIVDVAEARGLGLFGVMKTAAPGNSNVGLLVADFAGSFQRAAGRHGTVVVETVEEGTVGTAEVELDFPVGVVNIPGHLLGRRHVQVVKVVAGVERVELFVGCYPGVVVVHGKVHAVGGNKALGEGQTKGLHGMCQAEVVRLHVVVEVVRDRVSLGTGDVVFVGHALHVGVVLDIFALAGLVHGDRGLVHVHNGLVNVDVVREVIGFWRPPLQPL